MILHVAAVDGEALSERLLLVEHYSGLGKNACFRRVLLLMTSHLNFTKVEAKFRVRIINASWSLARLPELMMRYGGCLHFLMDVYERLTDGSAHVDFIDGTPTLPRGRPRRIEVTRLVCESHLIGS